MSGSGDLAAALAAAAREGDGAAVAEALPGATLLVALVSRGDSAGFTVPRGDSAGVPAPLAAVAGPGGALAALCFTGTDSFARWGGSDRCVAGPAREVARLIRRQGLTRAIVDPAGPVSATLEHHELRALASSASLARDVRAGPAPEGLSAPLSLRAPEPPAPALAGALAAAAAQEPAIAAAWLWEGRPAGAARHLVVGLELDDGAPEVSAIVNRLDAALVPHAPLHAGVDYTVVERDGVLSALDAAAPAVYVRP